MTPNLNLAPLACGLALLAASGCAGRSAPLCDETRAAGATFTCGLADHPDRPYDVHLPPQWSPQAQVPVVLVLHGGGGSKGSAATLACPEGRPGPRCLDGLADREGFAVVYPNGTGKRLLSEVRTWNAGGGAGEWQCVSGQACADGVDELAYFDALFADLDRWLAPDPKRVFATGMSNGAAMSHRLACERAGRVAAIGPVGGGNQLAAVQGCTPARPVPVLQIHGVEDPCWAFAGGAGACLQDDGKAKVSIPETMAGWAARNGCGASPAVEELPDTAEDGTRALREAYPGCAADVVLVRIEGGGHTWPGGSQYLSADRIGRTCRDLSANELLWEFFRAHPMD